MENGYIKLWRNINKNEMLANDNNAWVVFTWLLTLVDWRTGSYKTGRKKLAATVNLKERTLYDVLKRLQSASMIRLESNSYATTIYICNWSHYQQETNSNPPTSRQKSNTKQEVRKRSNNIYKGNEVELLKSLNEITKRDFRVLPNSAAKTLQKFTIEEIKLALTKLVKDEWHKPKVSSLSSDYLLRTSTIDRFVSAKDEKQSYREKHNLLKPDMDSKKLSLSRKELAALEYSQ
jgi:hypothetical protein